MMEVTSTEEDSVIINVTKIDINDIGRKLNAMTFAGIMEGMKAAMLRLGSKNLLEPVHENADEKNISIFSFDTLDDVAGASVCLMPIFNGTSRLYKNENRYFLLLQQQDGETLCKDIEAILHEYGQKHISNTISMHYLNEHGEVIIQEDAVHKLDTYFRT